MSRIDTAQETMQKLGWENKALQASFPEFYAVKDNFVFGEVWQEGVLDARQRLLVSVASLATVEGSDLEAVLNAALTQEIPAACCRKSCNRRPPTSASPAPSTL